MSLKINPILPKQPTTQFKPKITPKVADKTKQTNQAVKHLAIRFGGDDDKPVKKPKIAKPEVFTPKATIIKLKEGQKELSHQDLSYRVVRETLLRNNIKPSRIEMEEIMALPKNQRLDLHEGFDKKWKPVHIPGDMPSPGTFKDINGKEAFGYKMTLSPKWQAGIVNDYKQVRGELAKPENIGKKAVLDMDMKERLKETLKIAWDKGYISDEVKSQVGSITALEAVITAGVGGGLGLLASTELGSAVIGPAGIVLGTAYFAKKTMEFAQVAEDAGNAKSRKELDKPAKGMGQLIGSLARDGVLTAIGAFGAKVGAVGAKKLPSLKEAIENRNQVKETAKSQKEQAATKTLEPKVEKVNAVSTLNKATAPVKKFSEYIFKPGANHGKDKVFKNLGYDKKDSAKLAEIWEKQAGEKFLKGDYTFGNKNEYGQRISIEIKLEGIGTAKGKTSFIKSGWMLHDNGTITLNTPFSGFTK